MIPDRRPMIVTIPYGGNYPPTPGANIYGLDPVWITNPAARIALCRAQADTYGLARRVLHLPQGSYNPFVAPFSNYPAGCTLQANPAALIAAWTNQPGEEWGVYSGILLPVNPLGDLFVTGPANTVASTPTDADFIASQMTPFLAAGFREVLIDFSADNPTFVTNYVQPALGASIRVGCEALPVFGAGHTIDPARITITRYVFLLSYATAFNPSNSWTVNPANTECHVWIDSAGATVPQVQDFINRGFIPGIVHGVTPAAVCALIAELDPPRNSRVWMLK